jgi:hypothetical protein
MVMNTPGRVRAAPKHNSAVDFFPGGSRIFRPPHTVHFYIHNCIIFLHFLLRYALELRISKDTILYCDTCFTAQVVKSSKQNNYRTERYRVLSLIAIIIYIPVCVRNSLFILKPAVWDILVFGLS